MLIMRPPLLPPINREHLAAELQKLTAERLDARDIERVHGALVVHRATLYGADRLDANETMILTQMLEFMRARTADILRPAFKARQFVPFTSEVPRGAETWAYQQWDRVGMAKIIANYADDIPMVATFAKKFVHAVESMGLGYEWSWLDMQRTALAGIPLRSRKADAVRQGFEQRIEEIAAIGIRDTGATGLLNNANVPAINASPAAAGGLAPAWDAPDKTPDEILTDLISMEDAVLTNSLGVHLPDTLILPLSHYRIIQTRHLGSPFTGLNDTILNVFLARSGSVRNVDWWHYAKTAGTGSTERALMYRRDPTVVHLELPLEQEEQPMQAKNLALQVISVGRIGGVAWEYPLAAVYLNGL